MHPHRLEFECENREGRRGDGARSRCHAQVLDAIDRQFPFQSLQALGFKHVRSFLVRRAERTGLEITISCEILFGLVESSVISSNEGTAMTSCADSMHLRARDGWVTFNRQL